MQNVKSKSWISAKAEGFTGAFRYRHTRDDVDGVFGIGERARSSVLDWLVIPPVVSPHEYCIVSDLPQTSVPAVVPPETNIIRFESGYRTTCRRKCFFEVFKELTQQIIVEFRGPAV